MPQPDDRDEVVVVTGTAGMGEALARRLGKGRRLLLADDSEDRLDRVAGSFHTAGYSVRAVPTGDGDGA